MGGGFSLQDMQKWDQKGRKRGTMENLSNILQGGLEGVDANKKSGMEENLYDAKMRESGYSPKAKGTGMANVLKNILTGGGQEYEYSGKPTTALDDAKVRDYEAKRKGEGYYNKTSTTGTKKQIENNLRMKIAQGMPLSQTEKAYYVAFMGEFKKLPEVAGQEEQIETVADAGEGGGKFTEALAGGPIGFANVLKNILTGGGQIEDPRNRIAFANRPQNELYQNAGQEEIIAQYMQQYPDKTREEIIRAMQQ